ncbi:MAG TPA: TonB-dependent receptor plug domain-containing protein [Verrucomicrobiae bacterium]|nr:TonB-dependent receptor plug domain-containing protein [Verrucomicrobiae bacterium]
MNSNAAIRTEGEARKSVRFGSRRDPRTSLILIVLLTLAVPTYAETNENYQASELKKLSLEQLFEMQVTTVSKKPEKLSETASAIQVITAEDIERSGASSLPEALRLAPNLQVAQVNSHDWAITARGFNAAPLSNNSLADKLLVMIDGRSVYTPLFGGVFWDVQNVLLEDIDHIEVISGPGATLWGDNAINGVINVVTKSARDTQGLYVAGAGGSFLQDFGGLRYGGSVNSNFFFRLYGQRFDREHTDLPNGDSAEDAWDMTQGGFRADYYPSDDNTMTLQGDFYGGDEGTPTVTLVDGQNVLGRWTHVFSYESDLSVQAYYDRTWRNLPGASFSDNLKTYDIDLQHRFPLGERQSIVWGAGYRLMRDEVNNTAALSFAPENRNLQLFNIFLQDEITVIDERLKLTLGSKLEHNDYSGFEVQPSARLAWTPTTRQTVWAAVSRAVRSPARFDADEVTPFITTPQHEFDSEKVIAYELGYRARPFDKLTFSLAGYFNHYYDLRSVDLNAAPPPALVFANDQKANTWGVEVSGNFQATSWWRWRGGYDYLHEDISATSAAVVPGSDTFEAIDPRHQFLIQSMMDLPAHFQFDLVGRYAEALQATALTPRVPSYFTFDARLAWQFKNWELAVVGQNLYDNQHPEFGALQIPRSVYGKVTCRF